MQDVPSNWILGVTLLPLVHQSKTFSQVACHSQVTPVLKRLGTARERLGQARERLGAGLEFSSGLAIKHKQKHTSPRMCSSAFYNEKHFPKTAHTKFNFFEVAAFCSFLFLLLVQFW